MRYQGGFAAPGKTCQNRWKECQKENIVRIFPRPSPLREGPQWEDFCQENLTVDYQTLNDNQKKVFNRIEPHYYDVLVEHQVEPLRIIVMGTARTRKTYLIEAIRGRLQEMAETGSKSPIVVLAPTGGERLKQLQNRLKELRYIIIDEKSMKIGYYAGRFGQLSPVRDLPMYASTKRDELSDSSFAAYKQFKEAYKLNVVQRQSGNSKEQ
ncbi:hypothetical protein RhiirA5_435717 [Rhizophagus irregularis]|uniref:Uncharacterized protein n=1 Tax=Rhizophagus irregularis TaxID=588596 RepID=A0A2N0NN03_9GLOM|nr:hypothetical protein RhiirA5_435717 [Rhizophagus irregularis]